MAEEANPARGENEEGPGEPPTRNENEAEADPINSPDISDRESSFGDLPLPPPVTPNHKLPDRLEIGGNYNHIEYNRHVPKDDPLHQVYKWRWLIHKWLDPLDQSDLIADMVSLDDLGPQRRITLRGEISDWIDGSSSKKYLRVSGYQGTGKTVLAATITHQVHRHLTIVDYRNPRRYPRDLLAYFICSKAENKYYSFNQFARNIISLLCQTNAIPQVVKNYYRWYNLHYHGLKLTSGRLLRLLIHLLKELNTSRATTYLVVDGLDRVHMNMQPFYNKFFEELLTKTSIPNLRILFSCQDTRNTKQFFTYGSIVWTLVDLNDVCIVRNAQQRHVQWWFKNSLHLTTLATDLREELENQFGHWITRGNPSFDDLRIVLEELIEAPKITQKSIQIFIKRYVDRNFAMNLPASPRTIRRGRGGGDNGNNGGGRRGDDGPNPLRREAYRFPEESRIANRRLSSLRSHTGHFLSSAIDIDLEKVARSPKRAKVSRSFLNLNREYGSVEIQDLHASDQWMGRYSKFLQKWINPLRVKRGDQEYNQPPTRIAILDVGFDLKDPAIRGAKNRIVVTQSWILDEMDSEEDDMDLEEDEIPLGPLGWSDDRRASRISQLERDSLVEKRMRDKSGHGTQAIALLLKMAPDAAIYAGRIFDEDDSSDREEELGRGIAKAIKTAADTWDVQFLILPFTFSQKPLTIVTEAIQHAYEEGISIFCPLTSKHRNSDFAHPITKLPMVHWINSTDASGTSSSSTQTGFKGDDFAAIGENVRRLPPTNGRGGSAATGTGVATVVAAAMVASTFAYAKESLDRDVVERLLSTTEGVTALMRLLGNGERLNYLNTSEIFMGTEKSATSMILSELKQLEALSRT